MAQPRTHAAAVSDRHRADGSPCGGRVIGDRIGIVRVFNQIAALRPVGADTAATGIAAGDIASAKGKTGDALGRSIADADIAAWAVTDPRVSVAKETIVNIWNRMTGSERASGDNILGKCSASRSKIPGTYRAALLGERQVC